MSYLSLYVCLDSLLVCVFLFYLLVSCFSLLERFVCFWLLSVCPQEGVWHPDKIVVKSDDPLQVEKFKVQFCLKVILLFFLMKQRSKC